VPVLTVASILKYQPQAGRREIPDTRGVGLYLVVQPKPSGKKSWAIRLRRPNGDSAKLTLGPVDFSDNETSDEPVYGAPHTLGQARQHAAEIDRKRQRGVDVVTEYKAEKLRKRTAAANAAANTFGTAVKEFFADYQTRKWQTRPRQWRDDARLLGLHWPPGSDPATTEPQIIKGGLVEAWADRPVSSIDGYAVHTVIDEARKLGNNSRARKLHSALSVLFVWLQRDKGRHITLNPVRAVWRPGPPVARERTLTADEIVAFWKACDNVGGVFGALWKTLLLTGCRLRECAGMTRDELGENGVWEVPSSRSKNHRAFVVPLSQQVIDIIARVPPNKGEAGLIFSTNGRTPVSGFSKAKRQLDVAMAKVAGKPVEPWRIHDLRRTVSTTLNESSADGGLGIAPHIVEAVLNHVSGAKASVAGTYNKAKYLSEKKVALARWGSFIDGLVSGRRAKVVPLRKKPTKT
jgi:integrase